MDNFYRNSRIFVYPQVHLSIGRITLAVLQNFFSQQFSTVALFPFCDLIIPYRLTLCQHFVTTFLNFIHFAQKFLRLFSLVFTSSWLNQGLFVCFSALKIFLTFSYLIGRIKNNLLFYLIFLSSHIISRSVDMWITFLHSTHNLPYLRAFVPIFHTFVCVDL